MKITVYHEGDLINLDSYIVDSRSETYTISRVISKTSNNEICEAMSSEGTLVALKIGLTDNTNELREEYALADQLRHPNILGFTKFLFHEAHPCLLMPLCKETLKVRLKRQKTLPLDEVKQLANDLAKALQHLHNQLPYPIVHRDVKPANVLFTMEDRALIGDFELSLPYNDQTVKNAQSIFSPKYGWVCRMVRTSKILTCQGRGILRKDFLGVLGIYT